MAIPWESNALREIDTPAETVAFWELANFWEGSEISSETDSSSPTEPQEAIPPSQRILVVKTGDGVCHLANHINGNIISSTKGSYLRSEALTPWSDETGEWMRVEVYARGRWAYEHSQFDARLSDGREGNYAKDISPEGADTPKIIHVGYSLLKPVPVFIISDIDRPRDHNLHDDNLFGCRFRDVLTNNEVGPLTILHQALLIPENLSRLKRWASGVDFQDAFRGAQAPLYELRVLNWVAAKRLNEGLPLKPMAAHPLPKRKDMESFLEPTQNTHSLSSSGAIGSDGLSVASFKTNLDILKRGGQTVSSFSMKLVPVLLYEYPDRLIQILCNFASEYPHDIFHLNLMIMACELWFDIQSDPYSMLEDCVLYTERTGVRVMVPRVDLATFIIYFPHLLRWTEYHSLPEYMHPMRFIYHMHTTDGRASPEFHMKPYHRELNEILPLLRQKRSRLDNLPDDYRITVYPYMMPGSEIPPFGRNPLIMPPEVQEIASLGIGNIRIYGSPTYERIEHEKIDLFMPKSLSDELICGVKRREHPWVISHVVQRESERKRQMLMFPSGQSFGPFWKLPVATMEGRVKRPRMGSPRIPSIAQVRAAYELVQHQHQPRYPSLSEESAERGGNATYDDLYDSPEEVERKQQALRDGRSKRRALEEEEERESMNASWISQRQALEAGEKKKRKKEKKGERRASKRPLEGGEGEMEIRRVRARGGSLTHVPGEFLSNGINEAVTREVVVQPTETIPIDPALGFTEFLNSEGDFGPLI